MSISATAQVAYYWAWNITTGGVAGDKANHTISIIADKVSSSFTVGTSGANITDLGSGLYGISLTSGQNTGTAMTIEGSSTGSTLIIGCPWNNLPVSGMPETTLTASKLDATVSSRMATYSQPTGFLAATFPTSVASPTNITAGTITTVTNLTNAPTAGDFTAAMKTSLNAATPSGIGNITQWLGQPVQASSDNFPLVAAFAEREYTGPGTGTAQSFGIDTSGTVNANVLEWLTEPVQADGNNLPLMTDAVGQSITTTLLASQVQQAIVVTGSATVRNNANNTSYPVAGTYAPMAVGSNVNGFQKFINGNVSLIVDNAGAARFSATPNTSNQSYFGGPSMAGQAWSSILGSNVTAAWTGHGSNTAGTITSILLAPIPANDAGGNAIAQQGTLVALETTIGSPQQTGVAVTLPSPPVGYGGNTFNLSGVTTIGGLTPIPLQVQQYCAKSLPIPVAVTQTGNTHKFAVVALSAPATIVFSVANSGCAVSNDGGTVTVAVPSADTQAGPASGDGWYWYLKDETNNLIVGEGPMEFEAVPNIT